MKPLRLLGSGFATVVLVGGLVACGNSDDSSTSPAGSSTSDVVAAVVKDDTIAASVPEKFRTAGVLKDVTYNDAPPDEYVVDGKTVGWEIDLANAVAKVMGLGVDITTSNNFDSFIPSLQNGRYDVSFTSWIVTPERAKVMDLVTLFQSGTGFATKKGSGISIKEPTDLCGRKVAVIQGSAFVEQLGDVDKLCTGAGKAGVETATFPSDSAAELSVGNGRNDIYATSSNQLPFVIKQTGGGYEISPLDYEPTPIAVATAKGNGLAAPIAQALQKLMDDGTYKAILTKWDVASGAISKPEIVR